MSMNRNGGMRRATILALSITILIISSGLSVAQNSGIDSAPGEDIDYTRELIEIEQDIEIGEIRLKLGESSMVVNYGDGQISFKTTQTKYMGIADLYDDRRGFDQRVGIPVETIFWQRLIGVGEYVDSNENGLFDVEGPKAAGTFEELQDDAIDHEDMLKWIDFNDVEWSLSEWQNHQNGNEVSIQFVISASNIEYGSNVISESDEMVSSIDYIFHVTTLEEEIYVEAVPHYRVTVDENGSPGERIDDSQEVAKTNVTGHVLNSTWKYDQVIDGWDIATDSDGNERNDTRLVVLTEMAYGVSIHSMVGEWMLEEFGGLLPPKAITGNAPSKLQQPHGVSSDDSHDLAGHPLDCGLAYVSSSSTLTAGRSSDDSDNGVSDSQEKKHSVHERMKEYRDTACKQRGEVIQMSDESRPEAIRAGAIHFRDNGANLGRIRWVSNATVDGVETEVLFQLNGARPVLTKDVRQDPIIDCNENGREDAADISSGTSDDFNANGIPDECEDVVIWSGVRMVGGYNYVLGESIYHDPEYSADILTIDPQSFSNPLVYSDGNFAILLSKLLEVTPITLGIGVLALVGIGVASSRSRREQAPVPSQKQYVPAGAWASDDDWSQYQ
ncbi:MAG: hypothetical protein CMA77_02030 [Euryarchaeota archaeon]|nr:hypothetical protein [Euryarchaeota archaeon]